MDLRKGEWKSLYAKGIGQLVNGSTCVWDTEYMTISGTLADQWSVAHVGRFVGKIRTLLKTESAGKLNNRIVPYMPVAPIAALLVVNSSIKIVGKNSVITD